MIITVKTETIADGKVDENVELLLVGVGKSPFGDDHSKFTIPVDPESTINWIIVPYNVDYDGQLRIKKITSKSGSPKQLLKRANINGKSNRLVGTIKESSEVSTGDIQDYNIEIQVGNDKYTIDPKLQVN